MYDGPDIAPMKSGKGDTNSTMSKSASVEDYSLAVSMDAGSLLSVLAESHGRHVADQLVADAAKVARGHLPQPKMVWPYFN